jgi:transcription antitermination factor NusG
MSDDIIRVWQALYTLPRQEFKAEKQLMGAGIDFYLPTIKRVKQWSDRKKKVTEPLLRGYIFIHASEKERLEAVEFNSIIRSVFDQGRPARIHDFEIENLRNFVKDSYEYQVRDGIIKGAKVRICEGPFEGVIGSIVDGSSQKSIYVSLEFINRTVMAHLTDGTRFEVLTESQLKQIESGNGQ